VAGDDRRSSFTAAGAQHGRDLIATAKARLDMAVWRAAGMAPPAKTYRAASPISTCACWRPSSGSLLMPAPKSWGKAIDAAKPIQMRGRLTAWPVAGGGRIPRPAGAALPQRQEGVMDRGSRRPDRRRA
jgi:hypothetical protein